MFASNGKGIYLSVQQTFVGQERVTNPLRTSAWEAISVQKPITWSRLWHGLLLCPIMALARIICGFQSNLRYNSSIIFFRGVKDFAGTYWIEITFAITSDHFKAL